MVCVWWAGKKRKCNHHRPSLLATSSRTNTAQSSLDQPARSPQGHCPKGQRSLWQHLMPFQEGKWSNAAGTIATSISIFTFQVQHCFFFESRTAFKVTWLRLLRGQDSATIAKLTPKDLGSIHRKDQKDPVWVWPFRCYPSLPCRGTCIESRSAIHETISHLDTDLKHSST